MQLVFATNNLHKLEEISALLGDSFQLLGLKDLQIDEEIPEDHDALEANASQKAWYINERTGLKYLKKFLPPVIMLRWLPDLLQD